VKFNFRADRTSRRGFTLVRLWTAAELLSRRVASTWITRRVALRCRRGTTEGEAETAREHPLATAGDKRFIVLSFYAPDNLECELHYFAIVVRTSRRADTMYKSPWPLRQSALVIRDNLYTLIIDLIFGMHLASSVLTDYFKLRAFTLIIQTGISRRDNFSSVCFIYQT